MAKGGVAGLNAASISTCCEHEIVNHSRLSSPGVHRDRSSRPPSLALRHVATDPRPRSLTTESHCTWLGVPSWAGCAIHHRRPQERVVTVPWTLLGRDQHNYIPLPLMLPTNF